MPPKRADHKKKWLLGADTRVSSILDSSEDRVMRGSPSMGVKTSFCHCKKARRGEIHPPRKECVFKTWAVVKQPSAIRRGVKGMSKSFNAKKEMHPQINGGGGQKTHQQRKGASARKGETVNGQYSYVGAPGEKKPWPNNLDHWEPARHAFWGFSSRRDAADQGVATGSVTGARNSKEGSLFNT